MPIDEVGASVFSAIFRFIGWLFFEVIIEILIKGLGYLLCRPFKRVDIDSSTAVIVGVVAWVLILTLAVWISGWLAINIEIDSCLDSGGRYNYESNICEYN